MERRARLSAFAAAAAPAVGGGARATAFCGARAGGAMFAAAAFGSPVPARAAVATGARGVRMDVTVVVGDSEPIESAIRRFKKDVTKSGHLFELRRRRYFETNTEKRLRKAAAARRKARMARNMKSSRNRQQGSRSANAAAAAAPDTDAGPKPLTPGTTPPRPRV